MTINMLNHVLYSLFCAVSRGPLWFFHFSLPIVLSVASGYPFSNFTLFLLHFFTMSIVFDCLYWIESHHLTVKCIYYLCICSNRIIVENKLDEFHLDSVLCFFWQFEVGFNFLVMLYRLIYLIKLIQSWILFPLSVNISIQLRCNFITGIYGSYDTVVVRLKRWRRKFA